MKKGLTMESLLNNTVRIDLENKGTVVVNIVDSKVVIKAFNSITQEEEEVEINLDK